MIVPLLLTSAAEERPPVLLSKITPVATLTVLLARLPVRSALPPLKLVVPV